MRGVGTQGRAAHVPAEVVELVADVGRLDPPDLLAEALGLRVDVEGDEAIGFFSRRVESDHVGQGFDRRLGRQARRRVKALVRSE